MATDARLSVGLASHPKTKKLIRRLGGEGAWRLVCLFLWCAANKPDGDLTGLSDEDIELAVDWAGAEGELVAALRDVGFLDGDELNRQIHDWAEHNPWVSDSEARSEKSRWAALCKRYGRSGAADRMPEYAKRIGVACNEDAQDCQGHANGTQTALPDAASSMPGAASGMPGAVPDSASGMPVAGLGSAPSPSPSPSPSPKDKSPMSAGADLVGGLVPDESPGRPKRDAVQEVFDHWRQVMASPRSMLDDKRRKVINAALKSGYTTEQLCRAIDGCSKTPHNMGQNDRRQKYNGLDVILRSADQIDRFIANDASSRPAASSADPAVLALLQDRFPDADVKPLHDGRYRVGSRFFDASGRPEVSL